MWRLMRMRRIWIPFKKLNRCKYTAYANANTNVNRNRNSRIEDTDGHTFKARSANTDAKVGQSNGYRIIYYAVRDDREVYLLTIYYKKEDNRIPTDQEIIELVETYCM